MFHLFIRSDFTNWYFTKIETIQKCNFCFKNPLYYFFYVFFFISHVNKITRKRLPFKKYYKDYKQHKYLLVILVYNDWLKQCVGTIATIGRNTKINMIKTFMS